MDRLTALIESGHELRNMETGESLETVLDDWSLVPYSVYAIYPSRRHVPAKVRAFLDFIVDRRNLKNRLTVLLKMLA